MKFEEGDVVCFLDDYSWCIGIIDSYCLGITWVWLGQINQIYDIKYSMPISPKYLTKIGVL